MFGFDEGREKRDEVYNYDGDHQSHFSHEVIAGGAAFEAMKQFEDHQRNEGESVSHGFAKEVLAGFAGAEVDKLAETKGMNFLDREKAKHHAKKQADTLYDERYGNQENYDPRRQDRHPSMDY